MHKVNMDVFIADCCGKKYFSRGGARTHEAKCWRNPANKSCLTCKYACVKEEIVEIENCEGEPIIAHKPDGFICMNSLNRNLTHTPETVRYNLSVNCKSHEVAGGLHD